MQIKDRDLCLIQVSPKSEASSGSFDDILLMCCCCIGRTPAPEINTKWRCANVFQVVWSVIQRVLVDSTLLQPGSPNHGKDLSPWTACQYCILATVYCCPEFPREKFKFYYSTYLFNSSPCHGNMNLARDEQKREPSHPLSRHLKALCIKIQWQNKNTQIRCDSVFDNRKQ